MKKSELYQNPRFYNMGGHMIDPPELCMKQRQSEDGAWWVDMAFCHHCGNKCDRYKSYVKMTAREQTEDRMSRGILETTSWKRR